MTVTSLQLRFYYNFEHRKDTIEKKCYLRRGWHLLLWIFLTCWGTILCFALTLFLQAGRQIAPKPFMNHYLWHWGRFNRCYYQGGTKLDRIDAVTYILRKIAKVWFYKSDCLTTLNAWQTLTLRYRPNFSIKISSQPKFSLKISTKSQPQYLTESHQTSLSNRSEPVSQWEG